MGELSMNDLDTLAKPQRSRLQTHWKLAVIVWLGVCVSGAILVFVIAFYATSSSEVVNKHLERHNEVHC
jgi:hypothetical protein